MVLKADQLRVKALLTETITLLCKNGLNYRSEFAIEALIGITLDQDDVFLISIKENINGGMGVLDTEAGSPKRDFQIDISTGGGGGEESFVTDDVSNVDSNVSDAEASNSSSGTKKLHRRRRRRRSNDLQDTRHSEDQTHVTDFYMDKQLDKGDMGNLPDTKYTVDECKNFDREPVDKKCRVKEEEENHDDDDDLIVVKEEMVDMSGVQQQSYLPADNSYSTPVFSGGTSWSNDFSVTPDTQSAQQATTALSSQTQHAGMSQLSQQVSRSQTSHLNTSQTSQQLNTSQMLLQWSSVGRRKVITLREKMAIIDCIERGYVQVDVARKFGIAPSSVTDIKKNKDRIRQLCIARRLQYQSPYGGGDEMMRLREAGAPSNSNQSMEAPHGDDLMRSHEDGAPTMNTDQATEAPHGDDIMRLHEDGAQIVNTDQTTEAPLGDEIMNL